MSKNEREDSGNSLGTHRVLDSKSCLPQAADKLDNSLPIFSNELLISVEKLNIDAASFVQMEKETNKDTSKIAEIILGNCRNRGKQQNAVTGSGGMLVGKILQIGSEYKNLLKVKVNDRVATLVSLTLTPLALTKIGNIDLKTHQVEVEGFAVLFESGIFAKMPNKKLLPEKTAMAVFDVAGAPAYVDAICKKNQIVVVIGAGGKAGLLSCVAARCKVGKLGKVIGIEPFPRAADDLRKLGVCDSVLEIDATDPMAVYASVVQATRGKMADRVVNVASVPNTEMSSILISKKSGKVLFFSMATSFTKVALGAEGVATSAELIFGNGYYPGHSETALNCLLKNKKLKALFISRYQ